MKKHLKTSTKIEKLEDIIIRNGFTYYLFSRGKHSCIYYKYLDKKFVEFLIFKIKVGPNRTFLGKDLGSIEEFPDNESMGKWAWTSPNLYRAITKFYKIEGIIVDHRQGIPESTEERVLKFFFLTKIDKTDSIVSGDSK